MGSSSGDVFERVLDHPLSHFRVLGPPGSGKTRLLLERYRALQKSRNVRDAGVFVLTYSNESYRGLTEAIVAKSSAHFGPHPVLKHSGLPEEIIASFGRRPPVIIKDIEEHLLLDKVVVDCQRKLKSDLRSICRSERFRQDLLEVCHFLLQNGVDEDSLSRLRSCSATAELGDVFTLYESYRNELEKRGLATYYDISWIAARCFENGRPDHPVATAAVLLVEDFQDIDPGQFELLTAIAPPGGPVALNVFGDPMGSVFGHRGTQHRYLMDEFPRLYGTETFYLSARCPHAKAIGKTIEGILRETIEDDAGSYLPPASRWERDPSSIHASSRVGFGELTADDDFRIETTRDELDEAYVVASRIERLISSGVCPPGEIAVVTNQKERYEPILTSVLRQRGIPVDSGRTSAGVFEDFVFSLLTLFDSPDDPIAARSILTSPLYGHLWNEVLIDDSGLLGDVTNQLEKLRSFAVALARDVTADDETYWMEAIVRKCLQPVARSYHDLSGDDSALRSMCRLLEAWRAYATAVGRLGGRGNIRTFVRMSGFFSRPSTVPRPAPHAVGFYTCREAKGFFFPVVFVVGCSELLFPAADRRESVIPSAELQRAFREVFPHKPTRIYTARSAAEQLKEEYHLLYSSLTRAQKMLYVTAPEIFGGQDHPAPCAILKQTIPKKSYAVTPVGEKLPPQIRFARDWTAGSPDPGVEQRLGDLSPVGARWHARKPPVQPVNVARFPLSKSSIETYLDCERRFFYRKILRIPEDETAPAKVGSLLHDVMAILGGRFKTKGELHRGVNTGVIQAAIDEVVRGDSTVGSASLYDRSLRHHLRRMIEKILDLDSADPGDYKIESIEENIPFTYKEWDFSGRIDRVEEILHRGRVIVDYKTGKLDKTGKTIRKKILFALDDPDKANWQVPLYVWGFKTREEHFPLAFKHVVTSTGDDPFAVTIFVSPSEGELPPEAESSKRCSYVLESELEQVMDKAVSIAETIFEPRPCFERPADEAPCRTCEFRRLCGRETQ